VGIDRLVFLALAVAVSVGAVWSFRRLRRRSARRASAQPPAADGTPVASSDAAAGQPLVGEGGGSCARCRRSFDTARFCPFDGNPLAAAALAVPPLPLALVAGAGHGGKICPHCTEWYRADEAFCGRDGTELVTVN